MLIILITFSWRCPFKTRTIFLCHYLWYLNCNFSLSHNLDSYPLFTCVWLGVWDTSRWSNEESKWRVKMKTVSLIFSNKSSYHLWLPKLMQSILIFSIQPFCWFSLHPTFLSFCFNETQQWHSPLTTVINGKQRL